MKRRVNYWAGPVVLMFALFLTACGGGGGSVAGAPVVGSSSGILFDGPVAGVTYETSSGVTGVTDATGTYNFNPGDTVTFSIGTLVLGTVNATGLVTPIDLAAGSINKLLNLLVLLHTLDTDATTVGPITIPANAAAIVAGLDLTTDPGTFSAALEAGQLANGVPIVGAIGLEKAISGFARDSQTLLSSNVWVSQDATTGQTSFLRVIDDSYLHGVTRDTNSGVEFGIGFALDNVDVRGFSWVVPNTPSAFTFAPPDGTLAIQPICGRFRPGAGQLVTSDGVPGLGGCTDIVDTAWTPAANDPTGIVGVWAFGADNLVLDTPHMVFFPDGTFLFVDPNGAVNVFCSSLVPGVEHGTYIYDADSDQLTISSIDVDTNSSCEGLSLVTGFLGGQATVTPGAQFNNMTIGGLGFIFPFVRIVYPLVPTVPAGIDRSNSARQSGSDD